MNLSENTGLRKQKEKKPAPDENATNAKLINSDIVPSHKDKFKVGWRGGGSEE